jgi:hypothetical protein
MAKRDKSGRWEGGGESPNPAGKPKGALSPVGKLRRAIEKDLPAVIDALLVAAKGGDTTAAGILLSRSLPPLRPAREAVVVDGIAADASPAEVALAVVRAAAAGTLPADVAAELASALSSLAKVREVEELAARIAEIERAMQERRT